MTDEQAWRGQQRAEERGMSRRRFVHGSAAVAGAAALLGRASPAWRRPAAPGLAGAPLAQPGGFTLVQASAEANASGSVTLTLPRTASSQGTLLVATVVSPAASTPFSPPAGAGGSGWQLGKAVTCPGGRVEQWYWADNPGGLYGPGAGAVFTGAAGQSCLGGIAEFASPAGTSQILDTIGHHSGSGSATTMPVTSAGGVFAGSLGVFSQAEFFGAQVPTGYSWTLPSGYANLAGLHNGLPNVWSHSWDGHLGAGYQQPSGGFSYTAGSNGWAAAECCYRAVTVAPIGVVGGEVTNCLDLDPTGQQLVVGGDVEGCWRTANLGDSWQPANYGGVLSTAGQTSFADIKWSLLETGVLYACTGKTGSGSGAFIASADGGCTWQQRNRTSLLFDGNGTPSPPRPSGEGQDTDRTVNRLVAQDPAGGYLYLVTVNSGVMRSADNGVTWTTIGLGGAGYYPRCIALNPASPQELWVGAWDTGNGKGGVWHTANARAGTPGWNQLTGYTGTVADLKVAGSGSSAYLYAACATSGVHRAPVAGGALASLNGTGTTHGGPSMNGIDHSGSSNWVTLDGYVDSGGDHQIIAGCSGGVRVPGDANFTNVVKLTLSGGATPPSYTDLTGPNSINTATLPPFSTPWWHAGASWQLWLGGNNSVNPHVLIDPNNHQRIFVTGGGGFFRSLDGGSSWELAVNGMPMIGMNGFAIDPNDPTHFVQCGDDYASIDVRGDPSGNTPAGIVETEPGKSLGGHHRESHAAAFDAADSRVYVGLNTAYGENSGGAVMYRASAATSNWSSTGYDSQVINAAGNSPAVIGLAAGVDQNGSRWAVAIAQGLGAYRWDGASWAACAENDGAQPPGAAGEVGQTAPVIHGNSGGYLYCFDRKQGVYRSTDYGKSWTQIWAITTADPRAGRLAVNPGVNGELWVSTDGNLYKLSGAGSGTVANGGITVQTIGGVFSAGAAGIAFAPSGAVYAIALPGTSAPAPPVTTLYYSTDGGANWADWCGGDGSAASYGPPAGQLGISAGGWLWATGGEHFGYWDHIPG
jgi:hypothetical protein